MSYYYSVSEDLPAWSEEKKELFYNDWRNVLDTITKYTNLYNEKKIVKGTAYYPRLKYTDRRGLRAFNELKKGFFLENQCYILDYIIKEKILPESNINYLNDYYNNNTTIIKKISYEVKRPSNCIFKSVR